MPSLGAEACFSGRVAAPQVAASFRPATVRRPRNARRTPAVRSEHAVPPPAGGEAAATTATAASAGPHEQSLQQPSFQRQAPDPYRLAGQRLRSLLNGVGDGEEEMLNSMLEEELPERKIVLCLVAASLVSGGAAAVCWLCGLDPLGGASLSLGTVRAAAVGGAAAMPLVGLKALLWSEAARQQLPFLEDINKAQVDAFKPVLSNLNTPQTLVLMATEVVPSILILLPATTGGIAKSLQMYGDMAGAELPELLPTVLALSITAGIAGLGKIAETSVSLEEYEVVKDAVDNADRYYRVMAMDRDSSVADAQRAADAFKKVALTWMARNQVAVRFAGVLGALEVVYLGVLWQATGDLAAPIVAALAGAAVDFAAIRRSVGSVKPGGTS